MHAESTSTDPRPALARSVKPLQPRRETGRSRIRRGRHGSLEQLAADLRQAAEPALGPAKTTEKGTGAKPGHPAARPAPPTPRQYVTAIDQVLRVFSSRTRADLWQVIYRVSHKRIRRAGAEAAIASVIARRRILLNLLEQISAPHAFAQAHLTLMQSVRLSIVDDRAIRRWIQATFARDTATAERWWSGQTAISLRATERKTAFRKEYNQLRRRMFNLPPLLAKY
jgi:hypothetical protein